MNLNKPVKNFKLSPLSMDLLGSLYQLPPYQADLKYQPAIPQMSHCHFSQGIAGVKWKFDFPALTAGCSVMSDSL